MFPLSTFDSDTTEAEGFYELKNGVFKKIATLPDSEVTLQIVSVPSCKERLYHSLESVLYYENRNRPTDKIERADAVKDAIKVLEECKP